MSSSELGNGKGQMTRRQVLDIPRGVLEDSGSGSNFSPFVREEFCRVREFPLGRMFLTSIVANSALRNAHFRSNGR